MTHTTCRESEGNSLSDKDLSSVYLIKLSPKDKKWDERRAECDKFRNLYSETVFDRYAERMSQCSGRLEFAFQIEDGTGTMKLKLQAARFCRVARCPVCQWRRSLMWRARAIKIIPKVLADHPSAKFLFLTLTVKTCPLSELKATLAKMNDAWKKLTKRKEFRALGWIKAVEVTRSGDDYAHPHFHCLLMVNSSYFNGNYYLSQEDWTELWRSCLKVDYTPIVDVRLVKPSKLGKKLHKAAEPAAIASAVVETLKYSVKPSDVLIEQDDRRAVSDRDWLIELTNQLHKARLIATGGLLKEYLRELEEEPEDLIHTDEDGETETDTSSPRATFSWRERARRYRMDDPK